ncbi:MAG TPA: hypothetical protein VJ652_15060 [Noviherbaspirillum sp.]|nr:hypothetical protein [Noviherbaspirillum sp.]
MQIECILKRAGGTKAAIDGTEYHFAPNADGSHVAEVADDAHIERFLGIAEAYRAYRTEAPAKPAKPAKAEKPAKADKTEQASE